MKWGRLFSEFDLSVRNTMTTATGSRKMQHHDAHHRRPILTIPSDTIAGITCKRIRIHLPYIQFLLYLAAYTNHILCIDPPNISSWGCTSAAGTRSFSCRYPSQPSPFLFFRCCRSLMAPPLEIAECATKVLGNHSHSAVSSARE